MVPLTCATIKVEQNGHRRYKSIKVESDCTLNLEKSLRWISSNSSNLSGKGNAYLKSRSPIGINRPIVTCSRWGWGGGGAVCLIKKSVDRCLLLRPWPTGTAALCYWKLTCKVANSVSGQHISAITTLLSSSGFSALSPASPPRTLNTQVWTAFCAAALGRYFKVLQQDFTFTVSESKTLTSFTSGRENRPIQTGRFETGTALVSRKF